MVGVLIVSHGRLAEALISSVQSITGTLKKITGISIWPREREEEVKERIRKKVAEVDDGDGVVILRVTGIKKKEEMSLVKLPTHIWESPFRKALQIIWSS